MERSAQELYGDDPQRADAAVFGRRGAPPLLALPLHDERPVRAETPKALLDQAVTSARTMFIRDALRREPDPSCRDVHQRRACRWRAMIR
jgi:hypothetical protein